jgi:hypothetical protein
MECMKKETSSPDALLPEWREGEQLDDAAWVAALEASRRKQFEELTEL